MAFAVYRVRSVRETVEGLDRRERRAYDAAVAALKSEGCRGGGKRLLGSSGGDFPMCQRSLYGQWRLTTVFRDDGSIVIVSLARHTPDENPNAVLADVFPGLSATGRRRSDQPPCCVDPGEPPALGRELAAVLFDLFGL